MLLSSTSRIVRALFVAGVTSYLVSATPSALADDLTATLVVNKVTQGAKGAEELVSADQAQPGDTLEYVATYGNETGQLIINLKPIVPIPEGTEYLDGSANPAPSEASLDGASFETIPLKRTVKLADGSEEEQAVPASEYRALRWNIGELKPGEKTKVSARVRLLTNAPGSAE